MIGAQLYDKNGLSGVSVPGAVILIRKAAPTGGSVGSSVNHIGFTVPNLQPYFAKVEAARLKHHQTGQRRRADHDRRTGWSSRRTHRR